jgi:hypothetical protein
MEAKKIITFFLVSLLISMEVYLQDKSPRGLEGIERFRIVIMGVSEDAKNLGIDRSYIQGMLLLRLIAENIEFTFDRPFYKKSTEVLDHLYNPKAPILFVEISVSGNAFSIQFEVHEVVFSSKSKAYKSGEKQWVMLTEKRIYILAFRFFSENSQKITTKQTKNQNSINNYSIKTQKFAEIQAKRLMGKNRCK